MDVLWTDAPGSSAVLLLAHGAGAAMDSTGMTAIASRIADRGVTVARFEFGYMAARRTGLRPPPPRAETLVDEYRAAVEAVGDARPLVIGGKSMGGRVASMAADALFAEGRIRGLVCLGYPFHPPERPEQLRTAHLIDLVTPTLICQGTRDPFGTSDEVPGYGLSSAIRVRWFEDGDHDLRPRKAVSGFTHPEHLDACADEVTAFVRERTSE